MNATSRQNCEIFHLEFIRLLSRSIPITSFAIKGGCNLRFFFGSPRYSEDLDLDIQDVPVFLLSEKVMGILESPALRNTLQPFGIDNIRPPDMTRAKQTETVQRFKVHLRARAGQDLPTKIEFSRRGLQPGALAGPVDSRLLSGYRLLPLIAPHYNALVAFQQKAHALVSRKLPQARDVFDLYLLSTRPEVVDASSEALFGQIDKTRAVERVYAIDHARFRDTVVVYLEPAEQDLFGQESMWDQIRLVVIGMLEKGHGGNGQ